MTDLETSGLRPLRSTWARTPGSNGMYGHLETRPCTACLPTGLAHKHTYPLSLKSISPEKWSPKPEFPCSLLQVLVLDQTPGARHTAVSRATFPRGTQSLREESQPNPAWRHQLPEAPRRFPSLSPRCSAAPLRGRAARATCSSQWGVTKVTRPSDTRSHRRSLSCCIILAPLADGTLTARYEAPLYQLPQIQPAMPAHRIRRKSTCFKPFYVMAVCYAAKSSLDPDSLGFFADSVLLNKNFIEYPLCTTWMSRTWLIPRLLRTTWF